MRNDVKAVSVGDAEISKTIARGEKEWGEVWCPHTATAVYARQQMPGGHWIVVATAHPAKFESIVEPLVGHAVPVPSALTEILGKPSRFEEIEANERELTRVVG